MPDFPVIWIEPFCQQCWAEAEIMWCHDNIFDPCPDCGRQPRRYVLADGEQWDLERGDA